MLKCSWIALTPTSTPYNMQQNYGNMKCASNNIIMLLSIKNKVGVKPTYIYQYHTKIFALMQISIV